MDYQGARSKWNSKEIKAWFWYIKLWEGIEHPIFPRKVKNTQNKSETEHAYPESHKTNEWPIISTPINKPNTQKNSCKWELIHVEMRNKEVTNRHTWNAHFKQRVGWLPALLSQLSLLWKPSQAPPTFFFSQVPQTSLCNRNKISHSLTKTLSPFYFRPIWPPKKNSLPISCYGCPKNSSPISPMAAQYNSLIHHFPSPSILFWLPKNYSFLGW